MPEVKWLRRAGNRQDNVIVEDVPAVEIAEDSSEPVVEAVEPEAKKGKGKK
jgi:hypothetical protein